MSITALYAGSFDPPTKGHEDIIVKASKMFDKLYVVIAVNEDKRPYFGSLTRKAYLEWSINGKAYFQAFRGLCRLRIDYAKNKANKMLISAQLSDPDEAERLFQKQKFWLKVQDYWKGKLELSYKWEKDYFGRE